MADVRTKIGGARRLAIDPNGPAPTVMADGIGDVNTSQYTVMNERTNER